MKKRGNLHWRRNKR